MGLWDSFLRFFRLPPPQKRRQFALDEDLSGFIQDLAAWERRSPDEVASRLVAEALEHRRATEGSLGLWKQLTPREQEVAALTCLGCTGRQVAVRLGISPQTVKSHMTNILEKGSLHSREQLRAVFSGWDFSNWDPKE